MRIQRYEVGTHATGRAAFLALSQSHAIVPPVVPLIVIGDRVIRGYADDGSSARILRDAVDHCLAHGCPDQVWPLLAAARSAQLPSPDPPGRLVDPARAAEPARSDPARAGSVTLPERVRIPLLGEIGLRDLSLPLLTVVLGAADGFNPCAMWTLVFLLGLLLSMRDRARRWVLGTAFVAASALVYYLIMAAWLNVLLWLGMLAWIRTGIAVVALGAGALALREFVRNPEGACAVTAAPGRQRVMQRLRELAQAPSFAVAFAGIVLLAFAVNVVELLCSAGIPAVYTQILAMNPMPAWQHHAYLLLYVLVFMADDLFVFVTALATLELTGLTGRYTRWAHLVGGVVLVAVGLLMLIRPGWLMLG